MKKIIIAVSVIALTVSAVVTSAVIKRNTSTILNQNVEALLGGETATGLCYNTVTTCEGGQWVLFCGGCVIVAGVPTVFSGTGMC